MEIFNKDVSVLGFLTISPSNATGNFLTIDVSGVVRHRTPAEVLADIGVTNTSELINDGESGNPFISAYTHSQGLASTVWTINHNLGRKPSVNVEDTAGSIVEGLVDHIDDDNLTITFNNGFSGEAHLN